MNNQDERVWAYLLAHRATADARDVSLNCDITEAEAQSYIDRISSETWRYNLPTRDKPGQRRLDYEKIKHVCDERIRQIDAELDEVSHVSLERKESAAA